MKLADANIVRSLPLSLPIFRPMEAAWGLLVASRGSIVRWPGHIKPGTVENGLFSGLDWFPTLLAAAGNPNITDQLLKGVKIGDRTYKNHLDGYNQLALLEGSGSSARHELFYFGGPALGAVRVDDMKFIFFQQGGGWPGPKVQTDMPILVNLRMDPFERTPMLLGETSATGAWGYGNEFFGREAWRFVEAQKVVVRSASSTPSPTLSTHTRLCAGPVARSPAVRADASK